ncbi:hypothetical protein WMY93_011968 [Mugilogobius chulae]|uniref:Zinc finger PHD-type domain-containing protein n=1 Tax=Mugilogobius chulae TaxID=88201 RepID=A0AAW0PD18_9GOBI
MIECDICQDWFHGSCVGVEEENAAEIDLYHCPNCQVIHGPSVMRKRRGGNKQSDAGAVGVRDPSRPVKQAVLSLLESYGAAPSQMRMRSY